MVRDRLHELQDRSNWPQRQTPQQSSISSSVVTAIEVPVSSQRPFAMPPDRLDVTRLANSSNLFSTNRSQLFLQHVNELRDSIELLKQKIITLQQRQFAVLDQTVVQPEEKDRLAKLIEEIKSLTQALRPKIRKLEDDLRRDEAEASTAELRNSAEFRIRRNHCEALKTRLNDLLIAFNQAQIDYKHRVSRRVQRQLDLAGEVHLSAGQVDQLLESKSQEVFYRQLNPISYAAKMAVEDAANRHSEILRLEQTINELNEIFRDMYELVHSQNEVVSRIETNVEQAKDFIQDGRVNVRQAITYKKSAQRTKCIITLIAICVLVLLLLILIVVFTTLTKSL